MEKTAYRRWIYYFLRKRAGYKHKEANEQLKEYGFSGIGYQYSSQEMKRFEKMFYSKKIENARGDTKPTHKNWNPECYLELDLEIKL